MMMSPTQLSSTSPTQNKTSTGSPTKSPSRADAHSSDNLQKTALRSALPSGTGGSPTQKAAIPAEQDSDAKSEILSDKLAELRRARALIEKRLESLRMPGRSPPEAPGKPADTAPHTAAVIEPSAGANGKSEEAASGVTEQIKIVQQTRVQPSRSGFGTPSAARSPNRVVSPNSQKRVSISPKVEKIGTGEVTEVKAVCEEERVGSDSILDVKFSLGCEVQMDPESRKMRVVRDNGWLQKGDMILAIDSQKIYSVDEIVRACKGTPGSFLLLRFKRRGEEMVLILQRPAPPEPAVCRPKPVSPGYSLGVKCREHYAPYASQAQVIISKVANGGPAVGHLQPGDSLMSISGHALQSAQMLKYLVQGPVGSYVQIIYARGAEHSVHQLVFERSILSDGTGQLILIDMDTEVDELHPAVEERFAKEAEAAARGICSRFAEEERVAKEAEAKARAAAEAEAARLAAEAEKACVAEEERVAKEAEAKARAAAEAEAARLAAEAEKARVAEEERVAKEAEAKARAAAEAEEKKTIFSLGVHLMAPRGGLIMVGDVKDKNSCCWGHVKPGDVLLEVGGNAVQTIHDVKAGCQGALGSVCHVLYRSGASNRIYRLDLQRTKDPETNNSVFVALSSSHTRVKQQDDAASEVSEVSVKVGSLRLDEILHDDEPQIEEIEEQIAKRKADLEKLELLLEKARLKTPCLSPVTHQVAGEGKTKTCSFSLGVSLTQPSPGTILVAAVKNESSCCWGRLQAGDQLLAVDGITVTTPKDVKEGCRGALGSICEVHYKSGQFGSAHRLDLQRTTDNENNPVFVALSSANPSFLPFKPMSANQPRPTTSLAASIMALGASSSASHQAGKRDNRSASPSPSDSKFFSPSSLRKGVNGHGGRAGSSQHSGYRSGDSIRSPSMSPTFAPSHMGTFYGMPGL